MNGLRGHDRTYSEFMNGLRGSQCAAHTLKMATAITESTEVRGTVSVTASAKALGMPAAHTNISGGSITLAISPGPSSASAGA